MSTTAFVACFRLSDHANIHYRIVRGSQQDAWNEANRLAALTGLDLLSVELDADPTRSGPMIVPAARAPAPTPVLQPV